jgi:hypothetical protein
MMLRSIAGWPVTLMPYPQYVQLDMIQEYHHKQQLQEPSIMTSITLGSSYLNKVVMSLDSIQIGNIVEEKNDMMMITDSNDGNKFTIPSYKVISVDNTDTNNIVVDIEYKDVKRYRIVE